MTDRMRRVDEAMREVLSSALADLKDPRVGFVTVTSVETTPDLRQARVYVSVLGDDPAERRACLEGLQSAHGFLQRHVASELRLKYTPQLTLIEDETARRAQRVEQLLDTDTPAIDPRA